MTFAAGETSQSISVAVKGDTTYEGDEAFFVDLSDATNATVSDNQGQITIADDEPLTREGIISDVTALAGEEVKVDVFLDDASDVGNFDVTLEYNAQTLTVNNIAFGEGLSDFTTQENIDTLGKITVGGFANVDVIPAENFNLVLFTITFQVSEDASGETTLSITELLLNDGNLQSITTTTKDGTITIENEPPEWTKPDQNTFIIKEGELTIISLEAIDPEATPLIYTKKSGPDWATVESENQTLSLTPSAGVIPESDEQQDFIVELEVTDGQHHVLTTLTITVTTVKTQIVFSPVEKTASIDETFTMDIIVEEVKNLAGFQTDLFFNKDVLEATKVEEGDFLKGGGGNTFFQSGNIDNTHGVISSVSTAFIGTGGVSGMGILISVTFKVKEIGESILELQNSQLGNPLGESITHQAIIGKVIVIAPQVSAWDVTQDEIIDIFDLILIAQDFGQQAPKNPRADVNKDGKVDIFDLILVAQHFGESTIVAAPVAYQIPGVQHVAFIEHWLMEARLLNDGSEAFKRGIVALERLLNAIVPEQTVLLPNYPNPFNPETWIPYRLSEDSDVALTIYDMTGKVVRTIEIGHKPAAVYESKDKAIYWNGRNNFGEHLASGIYFYTLTANTLTPNSFTATRKLLIRK